MWQPKLILNDWMKQAPTPKQMAYLCLDHLECLYGGAAGGGKSSAMLMSALQYVDVPNYSAILFRRTYADLALPGALMDRAADWLHGTAAHWHSGTKTWVFPSGATISFGYLEHDKDKYRYQGAEFQFVGFDELTQFLETSYRYLFSRLRRLVGSEIPIRMRGASNPGGEGHQWVYERFIVGGRPNGRIFIPAGLHDNPYVDKEEYTRSLMELDEITRKQLLDGLWVTDPTGKPFLSEWWEQGRNRYHADDYGLSYQVLARWISWDTALKDDVENAYTACVIGELLPDYRLVIRTVWRDRLQFPFLPDTIKDMAERWNYDGKLKAVLIEDKASGTSAYQTLMQTAPLWLQSMLVAFQPTGDKYTRGQQAAVWCKRDCVLLPYPGEDVDWLYEFESELWNFPLSVFKDQVDAFAQLIIYLENMLSTGWRARNPEPTDRKSVV